VRWTPRGVSGDIEDRRAQGGSPIRGSHLGVGGIFLLLLLSIVLRRDFVSMLLLFQSRRNLHCVCLLI